MLKRKSFKRFFGVLVTSLSLFFAYSLCAFAARNDVIKNDQSGIPDKGLYRAVLDELGKKRNQTFTEEEAQSIKKLEIPYRYKIGIKSLKGIEYLRNLERLDISGYKLKNLRGIEKLPKLTFLVAAGNNLTNLKSISKAKNLEGICIESNKLTSLKGIETLTNLEYICVKDNRLKSLKELKNLKKVDYLEADRNQLTNLKGLESLKKLSYLDVSCNRIESIKELEKLQKIERLYVRNNNLKNLKGLKHTKNLKNLDISYNQITKLPNLKKNQELSFAVCVLKFNRLQGEEIRSKLPERFFTKGKRRKTWLEQQLYYQNIKEGMDFITPADGRITKDITRIIGRVHKEAEVRLRNVTKGISLDPVKADENGVFVMDHLDLREWAGDQIEFQYTGDIGDVISLPKLTVLG